MLFLSNWLIDVILPIILVLELPDKNREKPEQFLVDDYSKKLAPVMCNTFKEPLIWKSRIEQDE
jgi:hypothetical protein